MKRWQGIFLSCLVPRGIAVRQQSARKQGAHRTMGNWELPPLDVWSAISYDMPRTNDIQGFAFA